uniref:Uncharacterized protein n=1 Tax=Phlegmariurus squarrosus TaxID=73615 RepID=H9M845_PHLSQ|nr:hypothetical protein HusqMp44 [Phlegmariurus squarrosus]AEV55752.1 hypothetical protein HusqMp44 [Phlegmariurus squarrosus]
MNEKPFNNQVIESINIHLKDAIRLRVYLAASVEKVKSGSFADPLRKLVSYEKEKILCVIKFAIEGHNNKAQAFNQQLSPYEFDNPLFDAKDKPPYVHNARNDKSVEAQLVQEYRDKVTLQYAGSWVEFFGSWKKGH